MARYHVSATATIPASPATVYRVLADYHQHHPRIIPPKYFRNMEVLAGGVGAGTATRFEAHVLGTTREIRHFVSEPEPGRVLMESDADGSNATTFTVDPIEGGHAARLTISTDMSGRDGMLGVLERWMTVPMLRRIYRAELVRIADYAPTVRA
jgi:hypothetical protein